MAVRRYNQVLEDTPISVFDQIAKQLKSSKATKIIPLHQGKTVYTAPVELREWGIDEFDYPAYHDGPSCGTERLIRALCDKLEGQFGESIDPTRIQVTCGITHALSIVFHCILRPGDEIIVLSPQWLFANGLVRAAGGTPVEIPFFVPPTNSQHSGISQTILPYLTAKTRGIYFNSPNNPTGRSLTRQQLEELANLAEEHGLWIISDNAYEHYDYSTSGFIDPATLKNGRDCTFSAYSFSKSFGLTGYRIGYLLSPPDVAILSRKFGLYSIYSVPTCCQFVALSAMRNGPAIVQKHRAFIRQSMNMAVQQLHLPATLPDGGFYSFLDLSEWRTGTDDFIAHCISEGVSLAPGCAFGEKYGNYARLCYSVVGHEDLAEGIQIINRIYDERRP